MSKYRLYSCYHNKKPILISWIQLRCKCGRFLGKYSGIHKLCNNCMIINRKEYIKSWRKKNIKTYKEYKRIWQFVSRHINEIKVGDYI